MCGITWRSWWSDCICDDGLIVFASRYRERGREREREGGRGREGEGGREGDGFQLVFYVTSDLPDRRAQRQLCVCAVCVYLCVWHIHVHVKNSWKSQSL